MYVFRDLSGWPAAPRSDRGEFAPDRCRELNNMLGVEQVFGSAYQPRGQSLIEPSHVGLRSTLKAYLEDGGCW